MLEMSGDFVQLATTREVREGRENESVLCGAELDPDFVSETNTWVFAHT